MLPKYGTRYFLWLCVVIALATGWGSYFRYTMYSAQPYPVERSPDARKALEDAMTVVDRLNAERRATAMHILALRQSLKKMDLSAAQKAEIDTHLKQIKAAYEFDEVWWSP